MTILIIANKTVIKKTMLKALKTTSKKTPLLYCLCAFCICITHLFTITAHAENTVPKPPRKEKALQALEGDLAKRLTAYNNEKATLKNTAKKAEKDYQETRKELVKVSASIQKNQGELLNLETQMQTLQKQQNTLKEELEADRIATSKTIMALQRISRTPPEAMIIKPQAPIDAARSASLLKQVLPVLQSKAKELHDKVQQYESNEEALQEKQKTLLSISRSLEKEEKRLTKLAKERKALHKKLHNNIGEREEKIAEMSQQAADLNDLILKLEEERKRNSEHKKVTYSDFIKKAASLPFLGNETQLPLQGIIQTRYNQQDSYGAPSKGLTIEGIAGALVVAPMDGTIRFAGYFKHYGNMVILEHKNGYHSLIAGLEKIDTVVDQKVSTGEPLGKLYSARDNKPPTLYFELRHKGKAVNPATKFEELS